MKWIEFSMYGTFSGNKVWSKSPIPHFDIYYIFRFKWILKKQKNDLWLDNIEYVNRMERYKNVGFVFIFTPANNQCNLRKRPTDTIIVMLRMHVRFHVCGHQNVIQSAKSSRSFFFCFFFVFVTTKGATTALNNRVLVYPQHIHLRLSCIQFKLSTWIWNRLTSHTMQSDNNRVAEDRPNKKTKQTQQNYYNNFGLVSAQLCTRFFCSYRKWKCILVCCLCCVCVLQLPNCGFLPIVRPRLLLFVVDDRETMTAMLAC